MRLFLLTALLAGVSTGAYADNWSKQWMVSGSPEIHVDAGDGRVHVTSGDNSRIEANITTVGWRIAPGEVTITENQTWGRVDLELHIPHTHGFNMRREIRIDLRVPRNTASFINTGDGGIVINGLSAAVEARTGDGSVEVSDFDGSMRVHTGDGHIKLMGRLDAVDLETGDGSIDVDLAPGSNMSSGWRMHTGDGHVTVRVPQSMALNLDAHSGDGAVVVDMPITMDSMTKSRNDLRGRINGGGQTLTIRTGDGAIHIEHS